MGDLERQVKTAVLLAAGRGTRLRPYTDTTPKPLLPYRDKPTLGWLLESLKFAGVSRTVIVTNHLEDQIQDFVNNGEEKWGMSIKCAHQDTLDGTATAVQCAVSAAPDWFDGYFLVTATDYIVGQDFYPQVMHFHSNHNADLTLSLKELPLEALASRSSVRYHGNFEITEVVEKPKPGKAPSPYSANLLYVFPPAIVAYLDAVKTSTRGERELQNAVNKLLQLNYTARGILQITPREWQPEL